MTKAEMITRICEKAHVSKDEAVNLVDGAFEIIKATLGRGEQVKIAGFGSFVVRNKNPRRGRNPMTGAEVIIAARKVVTFKASEDMKKSVNTASA